MIKVLLADDSVTIHKVVEIILTAKGYNLMSVSNGSDALEAMKSFKPNVVLADIEMPGLNGYELTSKIKEDPFQGNTPVLLLAGAFEQVDQALAAGSGADGILTKPFEADELVDKLMEVAGPPGGEVEAEVLSALVAETMEVEGLEAVADEGLEAVADEGLEAVEAQEAVDGIEALEKFAEGEEPLDVIEEDFEPEQSFAEIDDTELAEPAPVGLEAISEEESSTGYAEVQEATAMMPEAGELNEVFREVVAEKFSEFLAGTDLKAALLDVMAPKLQDAVEKVLWEIAPELTEKLIKEALADSMSTLSKELETVVWETVPELAESIINQEIQRIKQGT